MVPHDALYQYCTNGTAPLNKGVARALDKKCQNKVHRIVSHKALVKNCTNGSATLNKGPQNQWAARAIDKKYL